MGGQWSHEESRTDGEPAQRVLFGPELGTQAGERGRTLKENMLCGLAPSWWLRAGDAAGERPVVCGRGILESELQQCCTGWGGGAAHHPLPRGEMGEGSYVPPWEASPPEAKVAVGEGTIPFLQPKCTHTGTSACLPDTLP